MSPKLAKKTYETQQNYEPGQIIKANFPVYQNLKNLKINKLNTLLSISIGALLILSVFLYALVVGKQSQLESISKQAQKLYAHNIELQGRLGTLKSFDNIDAKLSSSKLLQKPNKVIEVNTKIPNLKINFEQKDPNIESMLGY